MVIMKFITNCSNFRFILLTCCLLKVTESFGTVPAHRIKHPVKPKVRIIGGHDAFPHAHPYQVGLIITDLFKTLLCGGSLITEQEVLTAAHCIDGAITVKVILGTNKLNSIFDEGKITYRTDEFIMHDDWDPDMLLNDIAIIKLPEKIEQNAYVKTVDLARNNVITYANQRANITGWGLTSDEAMYGPSNLQVLQSKIMSNAQCKSFGGYDQIIQNSHLCTSGMGGIGSCSGDSGGPLVINNTLVGIVSFGNKICEESLPSVFTRVSSYIDWILEHSSLSDNNVSKQWQY